MNKNFNFSTSEPLKYTKTLTIIYDVPTLFLCLFEVIIQLLQFIFYSKNRRNTEVHLQHYIYDNIMAVLMITWPGVQLPFVPSCRCFVQRDGLSASSTLPAESVFIFFLSSPAVACRTCLCSLPLRCLRAQVCDLAFVFDSALLRTAPNNIVCNYNTTSRAAVADAAAHLCC